MAPKDTIKLTDDDFKAKTFKTLPGGKYLFKVEPKSKIKAGTNGAVMETWLKCVDKNHKGINVIDNIGANVGWKIAQLLKAFGIDAKKAAKLKLNTLTAIMKYIVGKEIGAVVKVELYNGNKQNKVVTYLPLKEMTAGEEEEEEEEDTEEEADEEESDADDDEEEDDDDSDDADEDDDDDEEDDDDDEDADEDDDDEDDDEDADEEDEDDDDDDEEEDDAPPARRASKKPVKKVAKKATVKKPVTKSAKKRK
jgi:hypothetical protein